jgi:hypothetical protein
VQTRLEQHTTPLLSGGPHRREEHEPDQNLKTGNPSLVSSVTLGEQDGAGALDSLLLRGAPPSPGLVVRDVRLPMPPKPESPPVHQSWPPHAIGAGGFAPARRLLGGDASPLVSFGREVQRALAAGDVHHEGLLQLPLEAGEHASGAGPARWTSSVLLSEP